MVVFIVLLVFIPGSNKKRKAFRRRMMRHPISHISPHVHNFTIGVSTDRAHRLPLLDPHTTAYGRFGGRDFFRPTCLHSITKPYCEVSCDQVILFARSWNSIPLDTSPLDLLSSPMTRQIVQTTTILPLSCKMGLLAK